MRPSSHKTYQGYIDNHIKPNIGKVSLNKLSSLDLQKLYKRLLSGGRVERVESKKQPKGLSAKTVRNINQVISSATAQRWAKVPSQELSDFLVDALKSDSGADK